MSLTTKKIEDNFDMEEEWVLFLIVWLGDYIGLRYWQGEIEGEMKGSEIGF